MQCFASQCISKHCSHGAWSLHHSYPESHLCSSRMPVLRQWFYTSVHCVQCEVISMLAAHRRPIAICKYENLLSTTAALLQYALQTSKYVLECLMCCNVKALNRSWNMLVQWLYTAMHQRCCKCVLLLCVAVRSLSINKLKVCHALQYLQSLQCCAISRSAYTQTHTCVMRIYMCVYTF